MKPFSADALCRVVTGKIAHGKNVAIHHGAYRLKQIKKKNTVLFTEHHLVNWTQLTHFFPIIIVTAWNYSKHEVPPHVTIIHVANTEVALWKFIRHYRSLFQLPVVAITGTAGKTTTKEMLKHIVMHDRNVTATQLSTNSRTAFFHYLLSIDESTQAAIFETAVGAPGDLMRAGAYFQPTIGIITNIGAHHLDHCKTLEGYIDAKSEMLDIIAQSGTLIVNGDDANTKTIDIQSFSGKCIYVGREPMHDFRASQISYSTSGMQFLLHHGGQQYRVDVPGFGEHQVYNALLAIAAATEMGVHIQQAIARLHTFRQLNKQLQLVEGLNGALILDDTWSINTTSLAAALAVLTNVANGKKRIAVIGTITDVGRWGMFIHQQAAELIHGEAVDILVTVGEHAKMIAEHVTRLGFRGQVHQFNNRILAYALLQELANPQTIILVKGDMYSKTMVELARQLRGQRI